MLPRSLVAALFIATVLAPAFAAAQINFPKNGYYVGLGDSVAAGEGAVPVTSGYVYDLYDRGAFGIKQEMEFSNAALRGARSWDLRHHQVPQMLCAQIAQRPTILTITAGANDFLRGDIDILSIAWRVADAINLLLNNDSGQMASPVLDPVTLAPCRALDDVTILVSNYYSIPHPDPVMFDRLDAALRGFDQALRFWLQFVPVPAGSRVAVVDLYTPSLGREGLITIDRKFGYEGPFAFDVHPTNLGHSFIARQFEEVWEGLN
jgi:GDSL-like Lipase/Acylhydrolase family